MPLLFVLAVATSCGNNSDVSSHNDTDSAVAVIPQPGATDSTNSIADTTAIAKNNTDAADHRHHNFIGNDSSKVIVPPVTDTAQTGYALVYCPDKMIKNSQNIVTARITRDELNKAITNIVADLSKQESRNPGQIKDNLYQKQLQVYNKMEVQLQCDDAIFNVTTVDPDVIKSFASGEKELEWNWELKPKTITSQTVIAFVFSGIGQNNQPIKLGEKMLYVTVKVDARSFWSKWLEFLSDDPKYTVTVILVPLITFLGGYFLRRKPSRN